MKRRLVLLVCLLCAACNGLQLPANLPIAAPTVLPEVQPTPVATLPGAVTPEAQTIPPPVPGGVLRVWLPPQFAPSAGDPAAEIFQGRLQEFSRLYPDWQIDVRVKAVEGPAGLLESLAATNAAASAALPDLIALPRPFLETAASKGLIRPFDGLTNAMTAGDWYDYSRDLARIQNNIFGLPFAGDALVFIYRAGAVTVPPASWQQLTAIGLPMVFPVADPQGWYPLHLYQGTGGRVINDEGHPALDEISLTRVLTFTLAAQLAGVMPNWLGLYENYDQVWQVYQERRAPLAVNWISRYLRQGGEGDAAALLPTADGQPFAQANGWMWALVTAQPERQKVAAALAEFLVEAAYLDTWSSAAGYLPTRSTAASFSNDPDRALIAQVVAAAVAYPSADVTASVNPLLAQAMLQVFKQQALPEVAARQAADALRTPK